MNGQSNTNDLQKAIDEITGANAASDSANAVADTSSEIKEQLGVPPVPPTTGEGVPGMPTISTHGGGAPAEGKPEEAVAAIPEAPIPSQPTTGGVTLTPESESGVESSVSTGKSIEVTTGGSSELGGDLAKVRESALRELVPLMDKVEISAEEKFSIYTEVIENTKDKSIVEKAFEAAKAIGDEKAKAESLLKLVQMIDSL